MTEEDSQRQILRAWEREMMCCYGNMIGGAAGGQVVGIHHPII